MAGCSARSTPLFYFVIFDGVAKNPPYGVTAFFQDLDIPDVCLRP